MAETFYWDTFAPVLKTGSFTKGLGENPIATIERSHTGNCKKTPFGEVKRTDSNSCATTVI